MCSCFTGCSVLSSCFFFVVIFEISGVFYIYTQFYEYLNSLLLEPRSWLVVSLCGNLAGRLLLPHTEGTMAVCYGGNAAFSSKHLCLGCAVSQACQFASFSPLEVALVYYQACTALLEAWLAFTCHFWDGSVRLKKKKIQKNPHIFCLDIVCINA